MFLDAGARHFAGLVGGIVEHLNVQQLARIIESRDGFDQPLDHVALVVNRELNRHQRPAFDGRRLAGNVLPILEIAVDEPVAMQSERREDHQHGEIGNHDGEIERIGLIETAETDSGWDR